jgi:stage II sporulation protein AA (anti-sigma F factor antagonist)
MHIKVKCQDNSTVACLYGELDHHSAEQFKTELDDVIAKYRSADLILDLKNLSFMDSSGLGVLLGRYKKFKIYGKNMYIMNANRQIEKVFDVSGLYRIIKKIK